MYVKISSTVFNIDARHHKGKVKKFYKIAGIGQIFLLLKLHL